jgi:hypothetical protein
MSLLDRVDLYLFTPYDTVYKPPPKDDKIVSLMLFLGFLIGITITCGHYLAK